MPLNITCSACGQAFSIPPSRLANARYCSRRCQFAGWSTTSQAKRPRITCEQCGLVVRIKASEAEGARFCSFACKVLGTTGDPVERFWSHVDKTDTCWLWTGACFDNGYGAFRLGSKQVKAHRHAWRLHHGVDPVGQVQHLCNVRRCVRPDHLTTGNQKANIEYAVSLGRMATGERNGSYTHPESRLTGIKNPNAKLTPDDIRDIRRWFNDEGMGIMRIAQRFGVSHQNIASIVQGKTWRHVI